jgi:hypothetical protein
VTEHVPGVDQKTDLRLLRFLGLFQLLVDFIFQQFRVLVLVAFFVNKLLVELAQIVRAVVNSRTFPRAEVLSRFSELALEMVAVVTSVQFRVSVFLPDEFLHIYFGTDSRLSLHKTRQSLFELQFQQATKRMTTCTLNQTSSKRRF